MARLLPSTPDTSAADDAEPRVIGLDSEDADDLLSVMSSDTARELLGALHEEPAAPSEIADRVDTSLQNAQYHLANLEEAGVVQVVDTVYSEKGREMKVYAPADKPLVVVAGSEEETTGLRSALTGLIGGAAGLAIIGGLLNVALGRGPLGTADQGQVGAFGAETTGPGTGLLPLDLAAPGVLFFLGGVTVLLAGFAFWWVRHT